MKGSRGSKDLSSNGMKVCVRMCVPVVLTSHDLFHISRNVRSPVANFWSKDAPKEILVRKNLYKSGAGPHAGIVQQNVKFAVFLIDRVKGVLDGLIALNINLYRLHGAA